MLATSCNRMMPTMSNNFSDCFCEQCKYGTAAENNNMMHHVPPTMSSTATGTSSPPSSISPSINQYRHNSFHHPQHQHYSCMMQPGGSTLSITAQGAIERNSSNNMTECVAVPTSEHVAEIVGKQGCKIKSLRDKTNTYIKTPMRGEEPIFVITGRLEDVELAKCEIVQAAEHFTQIRAQRRLQPPAVPGQVSEKMQVPLRLVGLLVGPKGQTIKRIQQETNTYIITPGREKEPIFDITGPKEGVDKAREMIAEHILNRTGNTQEELLRQQAEQGIFARPRSRSADTAAPVNFDIGCWNVDPEPESDGDGSDSGMAMGNGLMQYNIHPDANGAIRNGQQQQQQHPQATRFASFSATSSAAPYGTAGSMQQQPKYHQHNGGNVLIQYQQQNGSGSAGGYSYQNGASSNGGTLISHRSSSGVHPHRHLNSYNSMSNGDAGMMMRSGGGGEQHSMQNMMQNNNNNNSKMRSASFSTANNGNGCFRDAPASPEPGQMYRMGNGHAANGRHNSLQYPTMSDFYGGEPNGNEMNARNGAMSNGSNGFYNHLHQQPQQQQQFQQKSNQFGDSNFRRLNSESASQSYAASNNNNNNNTTWQSAAGGTNGNENLLHGQQRRCSLQPTAFNDDHYYYRGGNEPPQMAPVTPTNLIISKSDLNGNSSLWSSAASAASTSALLPEMEKIMSSMSIGEKNSGENGVGFKNGSVEHGKNASTSSEDNIWTGNNFGSSSSTNGLLSNGSSKLFSF